MKKIVLAAGLMFATVYSEAENLIIENVHQVMLRNSDVIKEGSEVKGYYFFYVNDKIDKSTNEYTLQITDNNLVKLKDIKFRDSKNVTVLESAFNGTDLIFLFYNKDEGTFEYQVYGADGQKKYTYNRTLSKKEEKYLKMIHRALDDEENTYKGLYAIEGKGFVSNMPSREDNDHTFQIDFFSTEKKGHWTYVPTLDGKNFIGEYLGYFNGVVYLEVLRLWGSKGDGSESTIVGLDIEAGKKILEKSTDFGKYKFHPSSMSVVANGKAVLFGEYFSIKESIFNDKPLGFAFVGIDEKGSILNQKYCSWDEEIEKVLNASRQGKKGDFDDVYLHNVIQTADGRVFAIAEGFNIKWDMSARFGGVYANRNPVTAKITDLVVFQFDKDFTLKEAKIYGKQPNEVVLHPSLQYMNPSLLGKYVKFYYGKFDYAYSQMNKDNTSFAICYSNYVKGKSYKGGTFNSISYNEGKITTDRINTKSDASSSIVMAGKQGQVLILDYYKKEKKLEAHFEKLN